MSLDGKSTESTTALESTRGCSNRCKCTTLDSDSGAGANAGSRLDMTFVGAGPLYELVWSPQKGLSVKCAEGNLCKEKPCILWCPEASKVVVSSSTDRATDFTSSAGVVHLSMSSREREPATCDQPENLETTACQSFGPEKKSLQCDQEEDMRRSRVGNNCGSVKQIIAAGEDDEQNPMKRTEEDDFPAKLEAGTSTKKVDELVAEGKMPPVIDTQSSSRIRRYRMKGKGRALSDGIPDGKMSRERDNSHESVESCNSAGLYSAGKKQLHYDPSLIVGSKRLKRHIRDSPGSSSLVRHDSSFVNWISNMMKGIMRENTVPSLASTLVDPDQGRKVPEQRLIGPDKRTGSAAFQTFFDSIYQPKRKAQEIFPLNPADQAEEYGAVELDDRVPNVHTSPKPCRAEIGSSYKLFKLPDSKSNECALQNGIGQVSEAIDSSKNLSGAHRDIGITASIGNKGSIILATEKGKDGTISDVPKPIFDAVKRLQLSRADVLKWMHSHMPLSCLDGFFLRLRLGKWDAGLGRPQYHVARITGVQKEKVLQNPKFSISVDVGGISCLVESRYISNQHFIEDELMAWWRSTSKGGGKVPSEEDLRSKLQEKKMLGLQRYAFSKSSLEM